MSHWIEQTVFYHIYPLGLCGCPQVNDYNKPVVSRLNSLYPWLEHIAELGFNGLYLGPLFESVSHGYDTTDYYQVDRRLGDNRGLTDLVKKAHELGIKVILDGVFNHVGRDFWAFRDLLEKRQDSAFNDWFSGLKFEGNNSYNDGFKYDSWDGHESLVKLNLTNLEVQKRLIGAVEQWVQEYDIDGLRLDAVDVMDKDFLSKLAGYSHPLKPDFWLLGEVVGGDYNQWANPDRLDSVTNYECFKGLYSSFNDHNMYEIAWSLNRQFGKEGIYRDLTLYSFADNHDVNRVASLLKNPAHLIPLYVLMFSMPGVPSVYYGSEFGIKGEKNADDTPLRPALDLEQCLQKNERGDLLDMLMILIKARKEIRALRIGTYHEIMKTNEQYAFTREIGSEFTITVINAADHPASAEIHMPNGFSGRLLDVLQPGQFLYTSNEGSLHLEMMPNSAKLLQPG